MTARTVRLELATIEGLHLAHLLDEFQEMLTADATEEAADPAVSRLAPDAYPEDADASRAFSEATRDDLLDRRLAEAAIVRAALAGFDDDHDLFDEQAALASVAVLIPDAELDAWLRTLTALRLVLATRLGIVDEDALDEDDPRRGVYDWLGYRLEGLIQSADELG
ncbi:hypothetical protein M2317_000082 [Microbacterium sp. ZKA21]|uniref:DUF2017 family protein n=1 Tax=Microbacterium sp. ZKA21 TaxID=3381694 RepID=UPI003D234CC2